MISNKSMIDSSAKIGVLLKFHLCIFLWHVSFKISCWSALRPVTIQMLNDL